MTKTVAFIRTTNIYDDSRATKEIRALDEAGYKVIVLGWNRNGDAEKRTTALFEKTNAEFHFFNVLLPSGIGLKNIDKLFSWNRWVKKQLQKIQNLNAVHSCNLDGAISAYYFCRNKRIPLIFDIYDYYVDSHSIPQFARNVVEKKEIGIINHAIATIICTEERREQIAKARPNKVVVVHNSPEVDILPVVDEKYDYVYCGSLCDKRLIKEIVESYHNNTDYCRKNRRH